MRFTAFLLCMGRECAIENRTITGPSPENLTFRTKAADRILTHQ